MDSAEGAQAALEDVVARACAAGRTDVVKTALENHGVGVNAILHVALPRPERLRQAGSHQNRYNDGNDHINNDKHIDDSTLLNDPHNPSSTTKVRSVSEDPNSETQIYDDDQLHEKPVEGPEAGVSSKKRSTTALLVACEYGQIDVVRALLRLGARTDVVDSEGRRPVDVADASVVQVLEQELLQQVAAGDMARVKMLLEGGVDANANDGTPAKNSMLHWAASFGQSRELLEVLVQAGAKIEGANSKGRTPLHEACEGGHVETASALITFGAKPETQDEAGKMPIELAKTPSIRRALAALFNQTEFLQDDDADEGTLRSNSFAQSEYDNQAMVVSETSSVLGNQEETGFSVEKPSERLRGEKQSLGLGEQSHTRRDRRASQLDADEVQELRRMNEEKDLTIVALRQTIETLLEQNGVLKYISKLQDEFRNISAQLQRVSDHKEHLQSMYVKCDMELERSLQDNALLRSALHEKEERLLSLLDETASVASPLRRSSIESHASWASSTLVVDNDHSAAPPPLVGSSLNGGSGEIFNQADKKELAPAENQNPESHVDKKELVKDRLNSSTSRGSLSSQSRMKRSVERSESIELILMERDRLAKELEAERRLRFSEARLHLGYAGDLRKQLQELQDSMAELASKSSSSSSSSTASENKAKSKRGATQEISRKRSVSVDTRNRTKGKNTSSKTKSRGEQSHRSSSLPDLSASEKDERSPSKNSGIFSAIFNSIFGDDESSDEDDDDSDSE
mmetsp:Transcript_22085/g.43460  ORF Transcript_22085/g.43460 Transcript_22085/m.43460 type:complete len:745 (-) Transcript_22085:255-2489(-)|eukprot:CAMPEP_0171548504 /NCGR_PEP_ID=MMETSP0960-20121227/5877_1 /TAXON_ID=87120 /ORGANISM="Aurantiochytrium limacinum, Strain ATCCMYA-1381" /LENGTH=744 /DNA_ID=CAMNT_0012096999 /DNA_START=84 /DNA_END=2318 /DNA_ORIENTATION=-